MLGIVAKMLIIIVKVSRINKILYSLHLKINTRVQKIYKDKQIMEIIANNDIMKYIYINDNFPTSNA